MLVLATVVAVALVALGALGVAAPAEAQRKPPPPSFDEEMDKARREAAEARRAARREASEQVNEARKFVRDQIEDSPTNGRAQREYERLLDEPRETVPRVESYFGWLERHFRCFADILAGAERCHMPRSDGSNSGGGGGGGDVPAKKHP